MKILWTDGSASPNPGPGGFAVIEEMGKSDGKAGTDLNVIGEGETAAGRPVVLGAEKDSTNIRMEGKAMIAALKYAGEEECEIHSDSEFWINVLTKWAPGWKAKGWKKSKGEIKNLDIVQELYGLYEERAAAGKVKLVWVRGHVGTELNELADEWANRARKGARIGD